MNDLRSGVRLLSLVDDTYLNDMGITDGRAPRTLLQFSRQPRTLNLSQMAGAWLTSTSLLMRSGAPDCNVFVTRRFPVVILLPPGIKAARASYEL